jgi:small-conductance mechanosensitive channel/uncharacterized protein YndB with AHSA1/START domain
MKFVRSFTLLILALPVFAQEQPAFNDIESADALQNISSLLANDEVDSAALNDARIRVRKIESAAMACAELYGANRARLEERFEPLREIDLAGASPDSLTQRQSISNALEDAIARQARCEGIVDDARSLLTSISTVQNQLSQQFLSARSDSVIELLPGFPARLTEWSHRMRAQLDLDLREGFTTTRLLWYLIIAGLLAALAGLLSRALFSRWYEAAGGDNAPAQMKYLFPKPLAEFAPLWLEGMALLGVLLYAIVDASNHLLVIRLATAIFAFGLCSVVIYWSTGPLSPSAEVKGLIPDHVKPLRIRLQLVVFVVCLSYVVLGEHWLAVKISQPYLPGRATMLFIVASALLYLVSYLGRIPGLSGRFRAMRFGGTIASGLAIIAVLSGYQNLAGYLVQGVTRTGIALFLLWVLLWLVFIGFNYLLQKNTDTATQIRTTLGITGKGSGTGIGFMQLVVDLVLWVAAIVYLINVWDNTGSTLGRLQLIILDGWDIGGVSLVPKNILGGILLFAVLVVIIGWIKRWIDRRWLKRIVIEHGARDAILTLFGYISFVIAVLISLKAASVDLTGLAIVSGALALGLGFGLQGIANNFVSGLILLFERPIRAGDFVSVGDVEGYVRSIRIRATEIETLDNQNVLVPNSELVSGRVTNWVLRDTHGRVQVRVGVAYGSDVEKVREILESIGRDHPEVITDGRAPAPRALFMGFGDSSLDFELRVRVQRIERRFSVMSDINFLVDQAFRDAGISIPFPQRDLHIVSYPDAAKPVLAPAKAPPTAAVHVDDVTRSHVAEIETRAAKEDIWAALTETDLLKRWFTRGGSFTPQIGAAFDLQTRDGYAVEGRIDIFIPPRRMRLVLMTETKGAPLPTGPITIDLSIEEEDDTNRLVVTVAGIPDSEDWEEFYRLSVDRWRVGLAELKSDVLGK